MNGIPQDPIDGVSLAYSFGDREGAGADYSPQYFEIMGSRRIYHDGWYGLRLRSTGPLGTGLVPQASSSRIPTRTIWELYNLEEDYGAKPTTSPKEMPEKLAADARHFRDEKPRSNKRLPSGRRPVDPCLHPEHSRKRIPTYREWKFTSDIHPHAGGLRA